MTFRVELTEAAAAQVEAAIVWWRQNRPRAVALLETELEYTFELLEKLPPSTQVWDEIEGKPVRDFLGLATPSISPSSATS